MKTRKAIQAKLDKLNDTKRKDTVIDFEQLGIDRLFIDESHFYKNLYLYTKMRNVGGIAQTEAQKSSDLFMKCRYLDEITGNRGTIFATGTPISNSMVELYSVQRYLQMMRFYGMVCSILTAGHPPLVRQSPLWSWLRREPITGRKPALPSFSTCRS